MGKNCGPKCEAERQHLGRRRLAKGIKLVEDTFAAAKNGRHFVATRKEMLATSIQEGAAEHCSSVRKLSHRPTRKGSKHAVARE
eukprot:1785239-Pleurochrysis_carterae.AAC.4